MITMSIQPFQIKDSSEIIFQKDWEPSIHDFHIPWKDEITYQIKNHLIQMKWDLQTYSILLFITILLFIFFYLFIKQK